MGCWRQTEQTYQHGRESCVSQKLHEKIVWLLSVEDKKQRRCGDLFNKGKKPPGEIKRLFQIDETDLHGGFVLTRSAEFEPEETVGKSFVLRVGYPKPFPLKVKKAPDARAIDVHGMDWDAHHATVHMDVEAENGEICKDRVRILQICRFSRDVGRTGSRKECSGDCDAT